MRSDFPLDPELAYLNHGAFGAAPRQVLDGQDDVRRRVDANPVEALTGWAIEAIDAARGELARAVHAHPDEIALVPNATYGLGLIARSLVPALPDGKGVLWTDHEYLAQVNLWRWLCERSGVALHTAEIELPAPEPQELQRSLTAALTPEVGLLFCASITSDAALVLPVRELCEAARERGVLTVIDGAHVPGHVPLDFRELQCDYFVGTLNKWFAAPRGAAFIRAPREAQRRLDPLVVGFGGADRDEPLWKRTQLPGTFDPSAWIVVPSALRYHAERLRPDGALELWELADTELRRLGCRPAASSSELLMRAYLLPEPLASAVTVERLRAEHEVEVQVTIAPSGAPLIRPSIAWYTTEAEVERLIAALRALSL
jgi:isopenicillin-N epimerase